MVGQLGWANTRLCADFISGVGLREINKIYVFSVTGTKKKFRILCNKNTSKFKRKNLSETFLGRKKCTLLFVLLVVKA